MSLNMEMGVLVFDGKLPAQAQEHFDELIETEFWRKSQAVRN
jgi:hypothetical protein